MPHDLLKVLIVDDEYLVRNLLKNCINWREIGYDVVGEASNAHEALDLVEQLHPDVIFTDIYMPFMDGLEFGKIVFERYPTIKIIVLTGYEEFEYAKKSVKIGIADFLLKPINDDEIRKVALNIKAKIESERNQREEYARMKNQLEENLPYLKEKMLNSIIHNTYDTGSINQQLDYFHIKLNPDHVQIAVIEPSIPDNEDNSGEEERLVLNMQCLELVSRYFRDDQYVNVFIDNNQNIVAYNSEKDLEFADCLEPLRNLIINKLKCNICIGIGNIYNHMSRAKASYKEACDALKYKIIAGKNQIISYSDINFHRPGTHTIQNDNMDSLAFYIKAGIRKKAQEFIEAAFSESLHNGANIGIETIRVLASGILSVILNVITELEIPLSDIFPNSQPFEQIFRIDTLPEMKEYLLKLSENAVNIITNIQNKKVNQAIEDIKNYMHENMSDPDMSLSHTAKKFFMNGSYLSRIFKQETGYTFVEYLTKIRMEKAIKLLKETDMKAYQVAESVGISNPHYFSICFKKWTGVSVNDFKKTEV
ncbi:MAG TPA: response regulator [Clostridiaceae bacterium]|nr:response regulator [Clostridiaceae bacterium]